MEDDRMANVHSSVFRESENSEGQRCEIEGYDFNQGVDYPRLLSFMLSTGFQASNLGDAIQVANQMNVLWSPSKLIAHLGKVINDRRSYLYRAYKNNIPVFCPGLTDGSLGDMLYFHSFRGPGLIVDVVQDIRAMNGEAVHASPRKTGMIILGGGLPKHHICNANMMRNGADYADFINAAQEYDGSDSGAHPDEAVSWGKIRGSARTVKVHCDATIAFPLLVAETFVKKAINAPNCRSFFIVKIDLLLYGVD